MFSARARHGHFHPVRRDENQFVKSNFPLLLPARSIVLTVVTSRRGVRALVRGNMGVASAVRDISITSGPVIVSVTSEQRICNGWPGQTQTWKTWPFSTRGLSRLFRDQFFKIQLIYWIRTNLKTIRQTFVASSLKSCVLCVTWDSSESK